MTREKEIYKIFVASTFYKPDIKRNGEASRPRKHIRHQINDEVSVDSLSDALDVMQTALRLAIKEHQNDDRFSLRFMMHHITAKCKCCGAWLKPPRCVTIGDYDGELFTVKTGNRRKRFVNIESIKTHVLNTYNEQGDNNAGA